MSYVEAHMRESLKDHYLEQILDTDRFKAFYMRREKGSRVMSTLFIFHPEGISICGDLVPGHHGDSSALGYGINWFAGVLSEGYLCSKFLLQGWHADLAEDELNEMAANVRKGKCDKEMWMEIDSVREAREALIRDLLDLRSELSGAVGDDRVMIKESIREMKPMLAQAKQDLLDKREDLAASCENLASDTEGLGQNGLYEEWAEHFENDSEGLPGWGYAPRESGWLCALQQKFSELYHAKVGTVAEI